MKKSNWSKADRDENDILCAIECVQREVENKHNPAVCIIRYAAVDLQLRLSLDVCSDPGRASAEISCAAADVSGEGRCIVDRSYGGFYCFLDGSPVKRGVYSLSRIYIHTRGELPI